MNRLSPILSVDSASNSPETLVLTKCTVDLVRGRVHCDGLEERQSTKEGALLAYLAARSGVEISREELLQQV